MIQEIVIQWEKNKHLLEDRFRLSRPSCYEEIVISLFTLCIEGFEIEKRTVIDDGDYQGTQIFIIPTDTYQPTVGDYVMTYAFYGSCSACDTLLGIGGYYDDRPTEDQVKEYMTLALHLVQRLKYL